VALGGIISREILDMAKRTNPRPRNGTAAIERKRNGNGRTTGNGESRPVLTVRTNDNGQPSDLESVEIPLPPLPVQRKIVVAWEAARKFAAETAAKIDRLERDIETPFLADLGLKAPEQAKRPKTFAMPWSSLERWSVMFNQLASVAIEFSGGKFPVASLGDVATVSYGIQKCPANRPGQHPRPYLRVANVQRGEMDLKEIKYIDVPDKEFANLR
jgi:type I restriction enzyme S subunit